MYIHSSLWLPYLILRGKKEKSILWFYDLGSITSVYACSRQLNMYATEHERLAHYNEGWITVYVVLLVVFRNPSWFCNKHFLLTALRRLSLLCFSKKTWIVYQMVVCSLLFLALQMDQFLTCLDHVGFSEPTYPSSRYPITRVSNISAPQVSHSS